jgi:hypothetical protein
MADKKEVGAHKAKMPHTRRHQCITNDKELDAYPKFAGLVFACVRIEVVRRAPLEL